MTRSTQIGIQVLYTRLFFRSERGIIQSKAFKKLKYLKYTDFRLGFATDKTIKYLEWHLKKEN